MRIKTLISDENKHQKEVIEYWKQKFYIPRNLYGELRYGITPEVLRIVKELPENKPCEECKKSLWHCTCMAELDGAWNDAFSPSLT